MFPAIAVGSTHKNKTATESGICDDLCGLIWILAKLCCPYSDMALNHVSVSAIFWKKIGQSCIKQSCVYKIFECFGHVILRISSLFRSHQFLAGRLRGFSPSTMDWERIRRPSFGSLNARWFKKKTLLFWLQIAKESLPIVYKMIQNAGLGLTIERSFHFLFSQRLAVEYGAIICVCIVTIHWSHQCESCNVVQVSFPW